GTEAGALKRIGLLVDDTDEPAPANLQRDGIHERSGLVIRPAISMGHRIMGHLSILGHRDNDRPVRENLAAASRANDYSGLPLLDASRAVEARTRSKRISIVDRRIDVALSEICLPTLLQRISSGSARIEGVPRAVPRRWPRNGNMPVERLDH